MKAKTPPTTATVAISPSEVRKNVIRVPPFNCKECFQTLLQHNGQEITILTRVL